MPKVTMKSRFHKEGLKGAVLRSLTETEDKITSNQPKVPDDMSEEQKAGLNIVMNGYLNDIRNQRESIKASFKLLDKKNDKGEFILTGDQYYKKMVDSLDVRIADLSSISGTRIAQARNFFHQEIQKARAANDTALVTQLEDQAKETERNMIASQFTFKDQLLKQKEALVAAQNAYQAKMKSPGPGEDLVLNAFDSMQDKGDMTDAEQEALQEKDVNLRKFYQERLKRGMDKGGVFSHLGSDNNFVVNEKGEFSFDIAAFHRDKNIEAIDSLYMPQEDGRMKENTGIEKFTLPKEYTDAYKKGFFSTISDPNATFNDAIFNCIRGFMARVVCDEINQRIQSKDHEKKLRNDEGLRSAMHEIAKDLPVGSPAEKIVEALQKKGYELPAFEQRKIGDDIPPRGPFQVMNKWADKDTKEAVLKHQNSVLESMFKQFKLNPKLGSDKDRAVEFRGGTTPQTPPPRDTSSVSFRGTR